MKVPIPITLATVVMFAAVFCTVFWFVWVFFLQHWIGLQCINIKLNHKTLKPIIKSGADTYETCQVNVCSLVVHRDTHAVGLDKFTDAVGAKHVTERLQ